MLDYPIAIIRRAKVQQADGELLTTATTVARCFAKVTPLTGRERYASQQNEATADYRFTIRRRSDLLENDVILHNGAEYNIRFIGDAGTRDKYTSIDAQRGVAN